MLDLEGLFGLHPKLKKMLSTKYFRWLLYSQNIIGCFSNFYSYSFSLVSLWKTISYLFKWFGFSSSAKFEIQLVVNQKIICKILKFIAIDQLFIKLWSVKWNQNQNSVLSLPQLHPSS
jgi:hypothetical protein